MNRQCPPSLLDSDGVGGLLRHPDGGRCHQRALPVGACGREGGAIIQRAGYGAIGIAFGGKGGTALLN